ncbi:ABC transporter permease subunit [Jeotgalibacillus sp. ET6]|uniref:ABC transporter permease subunit n=1 Tax=Jeotgalibacillus sp. ET6 TaxID=3037260 RepID=UPI0024185C35|nr:ABC transporter permease subunit [Jeotgalibacillus sp. ET6]MDG5471620.1 ABC transporter permease subunit [Jeotgalibacillus sp. ET6]
MKTNSNTLIYSVLVLLLLLLTASFVYEWGFKEGVKPVNMKPDAAGEMVSPPFPPSFDHPLGTDRNGNDLSLRILNGAKYTLIFVFGVGLLRVVFSIFFGALLTFTWKPIRKLIETFMQPYINIPAFILVYFLAFAFLPIDETHGMVPLMSFQFLVLTLVGIPLLMMVFSKEFGEILKMEYIHASFQLGASKRHIVLKHIIPVLRPRLMIVLLQQMISALILLLHLGVFQIFIGGELEGGIIGADEDLSLSKSGEWAGMVGQSISDLVTAPWIVLAPSLAFVGLILLLNIIIRQVDAKIA